MAAITPSTFDPLLAHVNVRLQQGVPIVDADWNLLDDIRKFELRAFLKWYVGDGVPDGNDGFRITGGLSNSFTIRAGTQGPPGSLSNQESALRQVGRFIVDGLDVFLHSDLVFTAQPLHQDQSGSAALAAKLGVPVIAPLTTPSSDHRVIVELDVWERLLTPDEEPKLVHTGLGVETCARTRREWVVRAYPESAPGPHLPGHSYATLALLQRFNGQAVTSDGQIIDRRQRRLLLPPAHLITDMLGIDPYEYRAGQGRPPISIREAVNALLAGQLPTTADLSVSPGPGSDTIRRAFVLDSQNGLAAFWVSPRVGSVNQIFATRLDLATPEAGFAPAVAVTSGTTHVEPTAVPLPNGEFLVAYQNGLISNSTTDVVFKRATLAGLPAAPEQTLSATAGTADETPFGVLAGDIVTFFVRQAATNTWFFRRYRHTDNTFVDSTPVALPAPAAAGVAGGLHASVAGGVVWLAYVTTAGNTMTLARLTPTAAAGSAVDHIIPGPLTGTDPFVVGVSGTEAMVFYKDTQIKVVSALSGTWQTGSIVTIPSTDTDTQPAAARDANGTCFLLATRPVSGAGNEVFLRRRDPATGVWGSAQQVISNPSNDQNPHPVVVPGQGIWVLWRSDRPGSGNFDLFAKRIVTAI
ncbi:DUF6519 domain-containing protein [Micromonospora purpureochromogenes]|uniref:DUF6519 domain-containing protein n=1 Tax=Micromonospora purpureochromogenes TaxID=47872 RepID=UPI003402C5EF